MNFTLVILASALSLSALQVSATNTRPVGQLFTHGGTDDIKTPDDIDDISVDTESDKVTRFLALSHENIVLCYRSGQEVDALQYLQDVLTQTCDYGTVDLEHNETTTIQIHCGTNYSFTEIQASKSVPECSMELVEKIAKGRH